MIEFVKTEALGNDFLLVEHSTQLPADLPALAQHLCHRNFGVGADGLIVWQPEGESFALRIFNCDGSEAECSGNGLRCAAVYLASSGRGPRDEIRLRTMSGLYTLRRKGVEFEADMGKPELKPEAIPFTPPSPMDQVVNVELEIDGEQVRISACSTGNPHCSLFVEDLNPDRIHRLGPALERHPAFPKRTNVEFIHPLSRSEIEVAFWERGVGLTYASGTGSCGATVACVLNGKTGRNVRVRTRAGHLDVVWNEDGRLSLAGAASIVARGTYCGRTG